MSILLIPLGMFIYLLINKVVLGDWFRFMEYQAKVFHNQFGFFANTIYYITECSLNLQDQFRFTYSIPALVSFLIVIIMLFYSFKRIRLSYIAYALAYLVVSFSPSWLLSGSRYISALAPLFLMFAEFATDRSKDNILTLSFTCLLGAFTLAFLTGRVLWLRGNLRYKLGRNVLNVNYGTEPSKDTAICYFRSGPAFNQIAVFHYVLEVYVF